MMRPGLQRFNLPRKRRTNFAGKCALHVSSLHFHGSHERHESQNVVQEVFRTNRFAPSC